MDSTDVFSCVPIPQTRINWSSVSFSQPSPAENFASWATWDMFPCLKNWALCLSADLLPQKYIICMCVILMIEALWDSLMKNKFSLVPDIVRHYSDVGQVWVYSSLVLVFFSLMQNKSSPNIETENNHPYVLHLCPFYSKSGQLATSFYIRLPWTQALSLARVNSIQPELITHLLYAGHSASAVMVHVLPPMG